MNCSIENIKDENLTKHIEVFGPEQGLITYLDKVAKGESTELEIVPEVEEVNEEFPLESFEPDFPFTEESIKKIEEGEKTITLRTKSIKSGVYKIGGRDYQINNQGFYNLKRFMEVSGKTLADVKEELILDDSTQDWVEGKGSMYVYSVQEPILNSAEPESKTKETALSKLRATLEKAKESLKKEKDEAEREVLEARIKRLKSNIDFFATEEVVTASNLIDLANEKLEEAISLAQGGNPILAQFYTDIFKGLIPTENVSDEILARVKLVDEKLRQAEEAINTAILDNIASSAKNRNEFMDGNGKIKAYVQDKTSTNWVMSAATSNNPLVRLAVNKVHNAMNVIQVEQNFMRNSIVKLTKALGKIRDPKIGYDFMLQKNSDGKLTGYTVEKKNHAYVEAMKKVRLNFREGKISNSAVRKYLNFIRDNHDVTFNQEAYDEYLASRKKAIEKRIVADDPSVRQEAIDKAYATVLYNSDPKKFKDIVTKQKRTDEEVKYASQFLRFYKNYMDYDITNSKFIDEKYSAIEQMDDSDPRKQFYAYYTAQIKKARLMSPDENRFTGSNYIPELAEDVNFFKKVSNFTYYQLSEKPEDGREFYKDPITGESSMSIPGSYMLDNRLLPEEKSYDLSKVLEKFMSASINKEEKAKVEDETKMIMHLVKSQPEYVTVEGQIVYEGNKPLERPPVENNAYESLKYFLDSQLYDKRQARDGVASGKRYDPVLTERLELAKTQLQNKEITQEDYDKIEAQWEASARSVTTKKVVNSLINFSSMKALSLNFFSGIAEVAQATSALYIEAAGGKFFNDSNLSKAYGKSIKMMKSEEETGKWFNNFPIINDFGYDTPQGKIVDKLFYVFKQSEKLAKGALLFARLDNIKIKDVDGNEVSLLDALEFNEKGEVKLDPTRFDTDFSIGSEFRNQVTNELHALSRTLLARDNNRDPITLNKHALGRLLGHFKASWLFEGISRRFSKEYTSELGSSEGYYRTIFFDENGLNIPRALNIIMTAQFHPEKLKDLGINDLTVANVKRALREFKVAGSLMLIYLASAALAGYDDDDDEMDDVLGKGVMNLAWRFNRDLTYFINPNSTVDLLGSSPMASISTVKQGLALMYQVGAATGAPFGLSELYYNEGEEDEKLKIWGKMEPLIPGWQGIKSTYTRIQEK